MCVPSIRMCLPCVFNKFTDRSKQILRIMVFQALIQEPFYSKYQCKFLQRSVPYFEPNWSKIYHALPIMFKPRNNPAAPPVSDKKAVNGYVLCSSITTLTISAKLTIKDAFGIVNRCVTTVWELY